MAWAAAAGAEMTKEQLAAAVEAASHAWHEHAELSGICEPEEGAWEKIVESIAASLVQTGALEPVQ